MKEKKPYLLQGVFDPVLNTASVRQDKPTIHELVTRVREEACEKYPLALNEKVQLIADDVRHAIAIVLKDKQDRYVLIKRKTIENNPYNNDNNNVEELAALEGYDFPLASRGVLPDSSFKVKNSVDDAIIRDISYMGIASEQPKQHRAGNDAEKVSMSCYEATIDEEYVDRAAENNGIIMSKKNILSLQPQECSSKVHVLKQYIWDMIHNVQ
ncbi:hypothetical protein GF369_04825 [Candidatus Peregrinibacteria bacterium]|nr:hypothetical protein [Candidatus Peregrinibacteria bacterium]